MEDDDTELDNNFEPSLGSESDSDLEPGADLEGEDTYAAESSLVEQRVVCNPNSFSWRVC